jgi:hypothetical protein
MTELRSEGSVAAATAWREPASVRAAAERSAVPRWFDVTTIALVPLAVLFAWYRGFRMPSIWAVTLLNVSIADGFHRRFLVGTMLRPFGLALEYDYWFFAAFAFAVLATLLVTICVLAMRARLVSQRVLVIAWLVFGAGGYLFDEVGYLDQVLYLLLFASLWCLHRSKWAAASVVLVAAVLTHEIALFTILPVVAFVAVKDHGLEQAVKVLAAPVVVNVVVGVIPAASGGAVTRLQNTLIHESNYFPRLDALALFQRSQADNWSLYSPWDVFRFLLPVAVIAVAAFLLVRHFSDRGREKPSAAWFLDRRVLACVAIASPLLLTLAGWDKYRWGFLLLSNFCIVLWIWIGDRGQELDAGQSLTVLVALVVMMQWGYLHFFDGYRARSLEPAAIGDFSHNVFDGAVFEMPDDGAFFLHLPSHSSRAKTPGTSRSST